MTLQELAVQVVQGLVHLGVEAAQGGGELLRGVASRLMRLWTSAQSSNEGIRVGITYRGSRGREPRINFFPPLEFSSERSTP